MFRIKQLAQERGFTTERLARCSHLKFGTVRNLWQNRTVDPSYTTVKALAKTLQVQIEDLEDTGATPDKDLPLHHWNRTDCD